MSTGPLNLCTNSECVAFSATQAQNEKFINPPRIVDFSAPIFCVVFGLFEGFAFRACLSA